MHGPIAMSITTLSKWVAVICWGREQKQLDFAGEKNKQTWAVRFTSQSEMLEFITDTQIYEKEEVYDTRNYMTKAEKAEGIGLWCSIDYKRIKDAVAQGQQLCKNIRSFSDEYFYN